MKVWITKYALTSGIFSVEAVRSLSSGGLIYYQRKERYREYAHGEGRDWHLTAESAANRAEEMRLNKIASHRKAIKKLEGLQFNGTD